MSEQKVPVVVEVKLSTLGGYYLKTEGGNGSRFVNYHAGPATEITLKEWPLIEESNVDPVFVLQNCFDKNILEKIAKEILTELTNEVC